MIKSTEKLEGSMVKITFEATAEQFEEEIQNAYKKNKKHITLPGFRKGKVPRVMIERTYGKEVFYEEAANELIGKVYEEDIKTSDLDISSRPSVEVVQIEGGKPFIFTAEVAVKPDITVGIYKGLEVEVEDAEVTDEEVEQKLKQEAEKNARLVEVTDRAVKQDDEVDIDFEGFLDGEPFEGGSAKGHKIVIGSHSFIDDFEEQLVGKAIKDEVEVNVTFPEDYHEKALVGKSVLFKVKINGIKEKDMPEMNDEFAEEVSEFDTLKEYKEDIKKNLLHNKEHAREHEIEDKVLKKAVDLCKVEIPDPMVEYEAEGLKYDFENRLSMQGIKLEDYIKFTGGNMATWNESIKEQAKGRIKYRLMFEEVAKIENIEATEEDVNAELEKMAEAYKMELDVLKKTIGDNEIEALKQNIVTNKARKLIVDEAVIA